MYRPRIAIILCIIFFETLLISGIENSIKKRIELLTTQNEYKMKIETIIRKDLKKFPISLKDREKIYYTDTYGAQRENGGHEGCDIMSKTNIPGEIAVVSATDGIITNLGWLYLGGYRVGITSENGLYYYYAHLDSYSPGLFVGKEINAGEFLGFMGNSGEGEEGTKGKFLVHLHFGIYVENEEGNEKTINPYQYLSEIN